MTTNFKLTKPIKRGQEEITELELREPTGKEIREIGFPYLVMIGEGSTDSERIELRANVALKYVSRLADVPPSSLDQLCAADVSALAGVVIGFFGVEGAPA